MNLKNSLYLTTNNFFLLKRKLLTQFSFLFIINFVQSQSIANYIYNGGFEQLYNCNAPDNVNKIKGWRSIDSVTYGNILIANNCYSNTPYTYFGFEYPKSGNGFGIFGALCQPNLCATNNSRGYFRNRLKANLIAGKTYCVKFYVNISENSSVGIDALGIYFGDNALDTITKINLPLTYINPQTSNNVGNIILDTLNWIPITGTFVANGTEKHCLIGNFKSDANTNFSTINHNPSHISQFSPCLTCTYSNVYIDDVSCIPLDLPANAGADIWAMPGSTVYIGRAQDVGIDEACLWYNLTNTTTAIANAAGFSLTVSATTQTYLVKQDICGVIKYDTVVVHPSAVGLVTLSGVEAANFIIYPNPANDKLNVTVNSDNFTFKMDNVQLSIINNLGQIIREEEITFKNNIALIDTKELANGVYVLTLFDGSTSLTTGTAPSSPTRSDRLQTVSRRFVIAR